MKTTITKSIVAISIMATLGGAKAFAFEDVATVDARMSRFDYRQGEIIVKFKQSSAVKIRSLKNGKFSTSNVPAIDAKLQSLGITEAEVLMPLTGAQVAMTPASTNNDVPDKNLSKLYRLRFDPSKISSIEAVVDKLTSMDEVEYAEPNYIVHSLATDADDYQLDPLYLQQWAYKTINLPALWNMPKITDKRPIIAIIDTGVEISHPDLKDNIWTNNAELSGADGADDDGNGYVDDINGWDFVNQTNHIDDFNGHGTHCAGIAAAIGGNGIGGVGANPDAIIMPVAVMQSDGSGDIATLIKGIDYATANGADIISMSIGTYAQSIALENALAKAYQKSILVAAAGNDGCCINRHLCKHPTTGMINAGAPMFPAAYTFVLGVQAASTFGNYASFSNYDCDGPYFSRYSEEQLYNYELKAPGTTLLSTFLSGRYKSLNGTSMACPLVAGAISRLIQCKEFLSKEVLLGDLIHTANGGNIDILSTYNISDTERIPSISMISYELNDSICGDGDFRADAGETIDIFPTIKNDWGRAENIKITIGFGENEDETIAEFIDNDVDFGKTLSSYAKAKSVNPIRIKLRDNIVDGRNIKFVITATCDNIATQMSQEITVTVENGVEIGGMIAEDLTLYPNVHYIVTSPLAIPDGVTLTIKPGTVLRFKSSTGISVSEKAIINCAGTPDSMIVFTMADWANKIDCINLGKNTIKYAKFSNLTFKSSNASVNGIFKNCIFENNSFGYYLGDRMNTKFIQSNILCNNLVDVTYKAIKDCNFIVNYHNHNEADMLVFSTRDSVCNTNIFNNIFKNGAKANLKLGSSTPTIYTPGFPNYHGTAREDIAREGIYDMYNPFKPTGYGLYDLSNMLTKPSADAHGIVWKVVVNGYDAQDEFDLLPPLGVGKHKFEVYFNRPMKKSAVPNIAMGVRPPYTQTAINEDGEWNEDGTIYTAYLTISGKSDYDGINRIYVDGAQDLENFEIPFENMRFNVEVSAAGSMSSGFMAEAGLGKINLTWDNPEENFDDMLGYNMYRYTIDDNNVASDTIRINTRLLEPDEVELVDYDVVPGTTYYYYYKVLRTSLTENSPSTTVAATPLTASKGDANGSMNVDVADVVSEIAYLTNQNPQPFIFEAADVNSDATINILDVVGTVNIIITPSEASTASANNTATYSVEDGILYVDSPVALGGVQISLNSTADRISVMNALLGFEVVKSSQGENNCMVLAYSMSDKYIPTGKQALLNIGESDVEEIILSDIRGANVMAINMDMSGIGAVMNMQMMLPYPNPFSTELAIPYSIGVDGNHSIEIAVTDLAGRKVHSYTTINCFGEYVYTWAINHDIANGIYFVSLYVDDTLMQTSKVIKK